MYGALAVYFNSASFVTEFFLFLIRRVLRWPFCWVHFCLWNNLEQTVKKISCVFGHGIALNWTVWNSVISTWYSADSHSYIRNNNKNCIFHMKIGYDMSMSVLVQWNIAILRRKMCEQTVLSSLVAIRKHTSLFIMSKWRFYHFDVCVSVSAREHNSYRCQNIWTLFSDELLVDATMLGHDVQQQTLDKQTHFTSICAWFTLTFLFWAKSIHVHRTYQLRHGNNFVFIAPASCDCIILIVIFFICIANYLLIQ